MAAEAIGDPIGGSDTSGGWLELSGAGGIQRRPALVNGGGGSSYKDGVRGSSYAHHAGGLHTGVLSKMCKYHPMARSKRGDGGDAEAVPALEEDTALEVEAEVEGAGAGRRWRRRAGQRRPAVAPPTPSAHPPPARLHGGGGDVPPAPSSSGSSLRWQRWRWEVRFLPSTVLA
ncbi:hypothetical protein [Oryza sativa Japonica Group]|uniref:Uncharacterized protein n=1 Tax=Oryza sativa subsp. japonica TaxID=39947 RepID=Q656Y3_ORYSJ|nr:hypothetical protein [Oryza sativa Japonica Group]